MRAGRSDCELPAPVLRLCLRCAKITFLRTLGLELMLSPLSLASFSAFCRREAYLCDSAREILKTDSLRSEVFLVGDCLVGAPPHRQAAIVPPAAKRSSSVDAVEAAAAEVALACAQASTIG